MNVREVVGNLLGLAWAPVFAVAAAVRHSRVLHPEGMVFAATVHSIAEKETRAVAERLCGPALVRFSTALWKHDREWPDALGCAIRFRANATPSAVPDADDQDLLFATIRSPLTTPLAPLGTNVHDFLANQYFATAPFDVDGMGRVKWRLVPEHTGRSSDGSRGDRLLAAVTRGEANLRLEVRLTFHLTWMPVAVIKLEKPAVLNQDELRFWPFRNGRGITPRGFVHALRRGVYRASQATGHPKT